MFTGIVEELGTVRALERSNDSAVLSVDCNLVVKDAQLGSSINVNGCCLTVTSFLPDRGGFTSDLMGETIDRTALGRLVPGSKVNLERSLRADGRLGGHLVQGHVDGVSRVTGVDPHPDWTTMTFSLDASLAPYVVEKGSVSVDGTSLTVTAVGSDSFSVGLIPHTLDVTVFGLRRVGDEVNIEVDVIAKYVERMLTGGAATPYARE